MLHMYRYMHMFVYICMYLEILDGNEQRTYQHRSFSKLFISVFAMIL